VEGGSTPRGFSRLETLPDGFAESLSKEPVKPGDVLAQRYKVLERLGGGAMGEVFVAENMAIGLKVAIKVLRADLLANREFRARFQKEAEAIAAIQHQNVVRFLDLMVGDPTFLVMELVNGSTLAQILRADKQLAPLRAVRMAERLSRGLGAAHRAGVVHRDLKPSNVLVATDEDEGELPRIIDFGLAKITAIPDEEKLTRTGQIVGTPPYMAPEQIAGRELDGRADVYSLGCVLYHLLAGRAPFETRSGGDELDVLYQHVHATPEPPSKYSPAVPPTLDAVVMKMLAKAPDDRYPSMAAVAAALSRSVEKRSSDRRRRGTPLRPYLLGVASALLVVGSFAGAAFLARRNQAPVTTAVLLDSTPAGATVFFDGAPQSMTTPVPLVGVAPGHHRVVLKLAGYADVERPVELAAGGRVALAVALAPAERLLDAESVPTGASVFVDGELRGLTPVRLRLRQGEFNQLRFEKEGYEPVTRPVKPDDPQQKLTVALETESQARGQLSVDADQPGEVWIDGAFTGFRAPTLALNVPVGVHRVELRDGERVVGAQDVVMKRGQQQHLRIKESP
jgi:tRNA A-37 threonylcarbamoyl transferase component Bud32